jgi:hypothetical protein
MTNAMMNARFEHKICVLFCVTNQKCRLHPKLGGLSIEFHRALLYNIVDSVLSNADVTFLSNADVTFLSNADVTFHAVPHRAGMTVGVEATTCGSISYAECTLEYQLPAYF